MLVQQGKGAVEAALFSKIQAVLSVEDYGAQGNGTTDDSAAFTRLCDSINDGRTVALRSLPGADPDERLAIWGMQIPPGEYMSSSRRDRSRERVLPVLSTKGNYR